MRELTQRCSGTCPKAPGPGVVESGFLTLKLSSVVTKFLVCLSLMIQRAPFLFPPAVTRTSHCAIAQRDGGGAFIGLFCLPSCPLVPTGALKLMHYK